jgi:hypothetical protein
MQSKINQLENELKKSYKDFFVFALDLTKSIDNNNNNLKFAVVNMQIALELFLKYYFLKKGKTDWLFSDKNRLKFKDFSIILDLFFKKNNELLVTRKSHLKKILEARNKIVHSGKDIWEEELAINLINTTLFIQNVLNREFSETLIETSTDPANSLRSNDVWRKGTEDFAKNLAELNGKKVYECWFCYSKSFVDKKIFTCDELEDEGFQCVTCLNSFYLGYQIGVAKCICGENSFVLDCLNPQEGSKYLGKCLNCDISYHAYKCDNCENYFLDFDNERITTKSNIFCSKDCEQNNGKRLKSFLM